MGSVLSRDNSACRLAVLGSEPPTFLLPEYQEKRKFMDAVKDCIQRASVTEEDAKYRARWRQMICYGDP